MKHKDVVQKYTKVCCVILAGLVCGFVSGARADIASTEYATNADNISTGKLGYAHIPVGTTANTVAAGDDTRFDTVSTSEPNGTPPTGKVFVWFE